MTDQLEEIQQGAIVSSEAAVLSPWLPHAGPVAGIACGALDVTRFSLESAP